MAVCGGARACRRNDHRSYGSCARAGDRRPSGRERLPADFARCRDFQRQLSDPGLPSRNTRRYFIPSRGRPRPCNDCDRRSCVAAESGSMDGARDEILRRMTVADFRHVRAKIQPYIRTTPIVPCDLPNVFLKLETLQYTHSFKLRGAFAHVLHLLETGDKRTLLTVSAGNHGLAVARAASTFNLRCVVIVPGSAPKTKIDAIRAYCAELPLIG